MPVEFSADRPCRILSLDGGGAKGFYTLGVLREIEESVGPLHEKFDLIFGTSTGAIIASLVGLGNNVKTIGALYEEHVPTVMKRRAAARSPSHSPRLLTKFSRTACSIRCVRGSAL